MALSGSLTAGYWYSDNGQSRGYTLNWSATQSIANNQSTITWWVDTAGTYPYQVAERTLKVTLAGYTLIDKTDRVMRSAGRVASGSFTITHDSAGNKSISGSISAAVYVSSINCSNSGSWSLNQIPRQANISTAPNFNDEANPTITYSNPAGNAVTSLQACISLTGANADVPYREISKTGTSYTFNLTDAERAVLRNATTTSNSREVIFFVTTVIGGITYYSTLIKTLTIVNATPTFTSSVTDNGAASTVLTGSTAGNVSMIKGFNYMSCKMVATAYKGATIKSYKITNGSNVKEAATADFSNSESNIFKFEVWDSRGNYNTYTETINMIDYIPLTCNIDGKILLSTDDSTRASVTFTAQGNFYKGSFGAKSNNLQLEYTLLDEDGYTINKDTLDLTEQASNGTYSTTITIDDLDYRNSYIVHINAADAIKKSVQASSKTLKATPIFDWGEQDFNFNVPIAFNNVPMVDFIEEQGEQDGWFYRKWNSGYAECWKLHYENGVNAAATNYNGFYYSPTISVPYPFTFTNLPTVIVDGGSSSHMNFVRVFGNYEDAATFTVVGLANVTSTNITVSIRAIGRWK